jgi:hypothetical protein
MTCANLGTALRLSFSPLFAERMALRECEVFFFGTAKRMGGNRSSNERRGVVAGPHANRDESGMEAIVSFSGTCAKFYSAWLILLSSI